MDGKRQFPCSCSHLARALAFPASSLQTGTAPTAVAGLYPQQHPVHARHSPAAAVGVTLLRNTTGADTHTAPVSFASGFKLNLVRDVTLSGNINGVWDPVRSREFLGVHDGVVEGKGLCVATRRPWKCSWGSKG